MTQRQLVDRIRPFLAELEARVEARAPGSSGGISEGTMDRRGDAWSQLTLEFVPSGGADLVWVMVYARAEDPRLVALAEFGREERVLGEFAPPPAPLEGDPAAALALAESVGAYLLAQEERILAEFPGPRG